MAKPADQQRNAERIPLEKPIDCTIDGADAKVVELSLIGAKIEHFNRMSMNSTPTVQFQWNGKTVKLKGRIARTEMRPIQKKPGYSSGVVFADSPDNAPKELAWIMSTFVEPIEAAAEIEPPPAPPQPKAAAPKKPAPPPAKTAPPPATTSPAPFLAADDEVEELDAGAELSPYVQCIFREDGSWDKIPTKDPKQPISGFTILTPEDESEIDDFCRTYEMADPETQRMIRLSFELGIAQYRRK